MCGFSCPLVLSGKQDTILCIRGVVCCIFTGCRSSQLPRDRDITQLNALGTLCVGSPAALLWQGPGGPYSRPGVNVFGSQVCCPHCGQKNCGYFEMISEDVFKKEGESVVSAESVPNKAPVVFKPEQPCGVL